MGDCYLFCIIFWWSWVLFWSWASLLSIDFVKKGIDFWDESYNCLWFASFLCWEVSIKGIRFLCCIIWCCEDTPKCWFPLLSIFLSWINCYVEWALCELEVINRGLYLFWMKILSFVGETLSWSFFSRGTAKNFVGEGLVLASFKESAPL